MKKLLIIALCLVLSVPLIMLTLETWVDNKYHEMDFEKWPQSLRNLAALIPPDMNPSNLEHIAQANGIEFRKLGLNDKPFRWDPQESYQVCKYGYLKFYFTDDGQLIEVDSWLMKINPILKRQKCEPPPAPRTRSPERRSEP